MSQIITYMQFTEDGRLPGDCYVYVAVAPMEDGNAFVKVGVTACPDSRIQAIMTGCPLSIEHVRFYRTGRRAVSFRIEHGIHHALTAYHSSGEWFRFDMSDKEHKKALWGAVDYVIGRHLPFKPSRIDVDAKELARIRKAANVVRQRNKMKNMRFSMA